MSARKTSFPTQSKDIPGLRNGNFTADPSALFLALKLFILASMEQSEIYSDGMQLYLIPADTQAHLQLTTNDRTVLKQWDADAPINNRDLARIPNGPFTPEKRWGTFACNADVIVHG